MPVNDAPVVTACCGPQSFTENGSPVTIASSLTVADADNTNLTGATVSITANFAGVQDVLALPAPVGPVTGVYNSGTGVLTLSGAGTVAQYQSALASVTSPAALFVCPLSTTHVRQSRLRRMRSE